MKRELKDDHDRGLEFPYVENRKAHPDEKGTESFLWPQLLHACRRQDRKAHPDEKGTESKAALIGIYQGGAVIARPIPMKRELKELWPCLDFLPSLAIARPIPMKRELKAGCWGNDRVSLCHRKAHPDEKGTESGPRRRLQPPAPGPHRKAHPDEKGTERPITSQSVPSGNVVIARPIPMKRELKVALPLPPGEHLVIARPIPMKRELKAFSPLLVGDGRFSIARPIPMKRELKVLLPAPGRKRLSGIARPIPMKRELKVLFS